MYYFYIKNLILPKEQAKNTDFDIKSLLALLSFK